MQRDPGEAAGRQVRHGNADLPSSELVCAAVRRDPVRYLDQRITPFATPRGLMGSPPPSRWRLLARRRWFGDRALRVAVEVDRQEKFSLALSIIQGESALAISIIFDDLRSIGISDRALDRLHREFDPGHLPTLVSRTSSVC
jgi:hypothetical protein